MLSITNNVWKQKLWPNYDLRTCEAVQHFSNDSVWLLCFVVSFDKCCMQTIFSGIIEVPFPLRIEVLACLFFESL